MIKRRIGRSDLETAPIALGSSVFGWTESESTSFEILDCFVDHGFDLIDTADVYYLWAEGRQGGESETIIGNWLKSRGRRDRITLVTKVGEAFADGRGGLTRDHIVASVEGSLRRLQTDHIDLYMAHIDDPKTPLDETLGAFDRLIASGKVRVIGASNYGPARLNDALRTSESLGIPRFESFQTLYNLCDRAVFEKELGTLCRKEDLGVLTYRSLARGFLTGKYRQPDSQGQSPRGGVAISYLEDRGRRILQALDTVAGSSGATPAQVALAWLITRPGIASAIVSASSAEQMDSLLAAADVTLSPADIALLDDASDEG
jgi:aryl-alcohol dehydrogenase-like predicted oxidoreductase